MTDPHGIVKDVAQPARGRRGSNQYTSKPKAAAPPGREDLEDIARAFLPDEPSRIARRGHWRRRNGSDDFVWVDATVEQPTKRFPYEKPTA